MNSIFKSQIGSIFLITSILFCGCRKFIQVGAPYTSFNGENVYTTDATAISAVTSMYTPLGFATNGATNGIPSLSICAGLSADELTLYSSVTDVRLISHYKNDLLTTTQAPIYWPLLYQTIYRANAAIEGLTVSNTITGAVKQQLLGESEFMRAFCYFYLVNLYGDVPLVLTTNYKQSSLTTRNPAPDVWKQIIADLKNAKDLMNSNYVGADVISSTSNTERVRPNKWTAAALLARAYLHIGDYANAETQSTEIISNSSLFSLSTINNVFSKNPTLNKEAIWQIQGVTTGWNTNDARVFILPSTGPSSSTYPVYLNKRLVNSFENNDARRINWVGGIKVGTDSFYYAYKYKSATLNAAVTEYNVVFRLAEQYLVRAEVRAMQGKFQQAIDDINTIRLQHGGLSTPLSAPSDQTGALNVILHERRVELFCEWGLRWFDLKRTNTVDAVMSVETPLKSGTWQSTDQLYPISTDEILANRNLAQTPGY